jgi:hypothetical protein
LFKLAPRWTDLRFGTGRFFCSAMSIKLHLSFSVPAVNMDMNQALRQIVHTRKHFSQCLPH